MNMETFKNSTIRLLGTLLLMSLMACEKELMSEDGGTVQSGNPGSLLSVTTRAGGAEGTVSYPVTVYVMDDAGTCIHRDVLETADDVLSVQLEPGSYDVFAVGGATAEAYDLPAQEVARPTSEIALKAGAAHGDLMTAKCSTTLGEDEEATVVLTMTRKVFMVNAVEIKNVPADVTQVDVTLSPLQQALLLDGGYKAGSVTQSIALARQDDGTTWKNTAPVYLLPANGEATISVKLTTADGVKSISYTSPTALEANHEVNITGTYVPTSPQFVTLNGIITGATWDNTINISFNFDENGQTTDAGDGNDDNSGSAGGTESGSVPAVSTWYKDFFVIKREDDATGEYTVVTILHKDEVEIDASTMTESDLQSAINAALPSFSVNGVTGWRLPTAAEFRAIATGQLNWDINSGSMKGKATVVTDCYYLQADDGIKVWLGGTNYNAAYIWGKRLRPVTTLRFRK